MQRGARTQPINRGRLPVSQGLSRDRRSLHQIEDVIGQVLAVDPSGGDIRTAQVPAAAADGTGPAGTRGNNAPSPAPAGERRRRGRWRNDDVVKMAKAGLDDGIIISKIKSSRTQFDTSPDALIALKTSGVSSAVLRAMTEPSSQPQTELA